MLSLTLALAAAALSQPGQQPGQQPGRQTDQPSGQKVADWVAIRAGTIHTVEDGLVVEDGTLLLQGGRIVAVGADVVVPPGVRVVDYGPDAVVVPGFVAADSRLAEGPPSERTAEPGLSAVDGFDFYASYHSALAGGVTSAYVTPARGRLVAGQGAVVKLAGEDPAARVLNASAAIHGAISAEARATPGYWQPPVPATVDVGMGSPLEQLPRTTMGAILALRELLAGGPEAERAYGTRQLADLQVALATGAPWRITALEADEIRALVALARELSLPLVLDGAHFAGEFAGELAAADAAVVYELPFTPNRAGEERSAARGEAWPELDVPARLAEQGVKVALRTSTGTPLRDLRFAALLAVRGGLPEAEALRAITLTPAELYGVADRVGSLAPGKDADLVVLSGSPLDPGAAVVATWVDGETAWVPGERGGEAGGRRPAPVVVSADELHVGDGTVLAPGEVLLVDGRVAEVGRRVARPAGAVVVSGAAAMPGAIDAGALLGLEGSGRMPATDYDLTRIFEPGDRLDRLVARRGVTTVVLDPRGESSSGVPLAAYHPAAADFDALVVDALAAVRLNWTDRDRLASGQEVRKLLASAAEYDAKWKEYAVELAKWKPEAARPEFSLPKKKAEAEQEGEAAEGEAPDGAGKGDAEEKEAGEEGDAKPKKKKKGEEEPPDPDPVTGIWLAEVVPAEGAPPVRLRLQLRKSDGDVEGHLRSALVSEELVPVEGFFAGQALELTGFGTDGPFRMSGKVEGAKWKAELTLGATVLAFEAERTTRDYPVAKRSEPVVAPAEEVAEPKGKPKEPRRDGKLEPLRRAMAGEAAVLVRVDRADEILACVEAFEGVGIRPVLLGAEGVHAIAGEVRGRVAGVLLDEQITAETLEDGYAVRNRYAELQNAGIPVAFRSGSESGAADILLMAAYAVANGMSPERALRALTSDAADMLAIADQVGRLAPGRFADVVLLDGSPLDPGSSVLRVWVAGREVR